MDSRDASDTVGDKPRFINEQEHALDELRGRGDQDAVVRALVELATSYWRVGEVKTALEKLEEAWRLAEDQGNHPLAANVLANLGAALANTGQLGPAVEKYERSLTLLDPETDLGAMAPIYASLGLALRDLGDHDEAKRHFQNGIGAFRNAGDVESAVSALNDLALIHQDDADLDGAFKCLQEALDLAKSQEGEDSLVARTLSNLGRLQTAQGKGVEARESLETALELASGGQDVGTLISLGMIFADLGNHEKAIECFERSQAIARDMGWAVDEANALFYLARIHAGLGDHERALDYYSMSGRMADQMGDRGSMAMISWNAGLSLLAMERAEEALAAMHDAVNYWREIGAPDAEEHAKALSEFEAKVNPTPS